MGDDATELATRAQADSAALVHQLQAHRPMVRGLCRRLDPEPDDCAQEIWEKVLRALPRYDAERGGLRAWIAAIARRHVVDRHRRRTVRQTRLPQAALPRRDVEGGLDLERALQRLPLAQRRVILFHHHQGLTLAEIAHLEDVAVGTVKSRLHRARAALVDLLEGPDDR